MRRLLTGNVAKQGLVAIAGTRLWKFLITLPIAEPRRTPIRFLRVRTSQFHSLERDVQIDMQ
jgi:hypothetical protein